MSVLAYAGLRPGEAFALTWESVGERTILVERSLALGELKETKTRSTRSGNWRNGVFQPAAKKAGLDLIRP